MQLRHVKTLQPAQPGIARVPAMCWSPNSKRLAVVDHTRAVILYDEAGEKRDRFSLKPADTKSNSKSFVVRGMAWSGDSVKLAIAQSDYIIFVYKLGIDWGEKKSICNKFPQTSPINGMAWPSTGAGSEVIIFGTQEGKVKVAILKTNKTQTLYSHESAVVCVAASPDGNYCVSGHADGVIFRYQFETEESTAAGTGAGAVKMASINTAPVSLSWGETIAVAGNDCKISFFDKTGHAIQNYDYPLVEDKEVSALSFNPSGQTLVAAAFNKLRLFNFNARSRKWDEGNVLLLPNALTITALGWKADGSRLTTGTLCGAVDIFDACLKRLNYRGAFEFTYVSHNQVIVKRFSTGSRIVLKSNLGYEIQKVNVLKDRYLVAHTSTTLLIGDLNTCKLSEVQWRLTGKERYVFDNPQVCMVFVAGELCLIEYGHNELLATCRTQDTNMHRMSVQLFEGVPESGKPPRKTIAYLIDRQTIQIDDLISGVSIGRVLHTSKVDWLELNHRATKLLFRDKQRQLFLFDLATQTKTTLLNFCTYVQWVPDSDVVVAQNRTDLCVWYSIEAPDRVGIVPIKGEVQSIERTVAANGNPGKTEVIVDEGVNTVAYSLDEGLIEFGTAMEDNDYDRACDLLDQIPLSQETEAMWQSLAKTALQEMKLYIAERCFAALGDVAKAHALNRISALAQQAAKDSGGVTNGFDHYTVLAELHILNKDFKRAEQLFLENGKVDKAIEMWDGMYRFDESILVAESRNHADLPNLRTRYFDWLVSTHQEEKAGELREREGKHMEAINLYLKGGVPARAANVITANSIRPEQQLMDAIASALLKAGIFEQAGDFFEKTKKNDMAINAYKSGHAYRRAVDLARRDLPNYVVSLEDAWGDYLVQQKQVDQAINHYIEAHQYSKAISAAISSRQWGKAVNILETQNVGGPNDPAVQQFYRQIGLHYEEAHQLAEAEKYFIKGGAINEAVEMYSRRGMSDQMYRVAQRHLSQQQITTLFVEQAKQLEAKGDYTGAERIFVKVNEPDQAIIMYKKARDFTNMVRLVQTYRPDYVLKTHLSLAAQFEKEGNLKLAEQHYISGKDWGKAVNMYRDANQWEDAVRVAKVNGGPTAAKQVVLSRAMAVDAEEGVRLLVKFSLAEAGVDAALEAQKFDLALQWAQLAVPGKLPYVFLKNAMYWEDQGEFRMAEDAFIKAGKPREAVDMYVHQHEFDNALRVAEAHDPQAVSIVCTAQGRMAFQQSNYKDAEALLLRGGASELLLKLYREARMYTDAQRIAKEYCPDKLPDVSRELALAITNPLQAGQMLEDNGEFELAIENYLRAGREHTSDVNQLAGVWLRAVRLAMTHARPVLKDTLKTAVQKLLDAGRSDDAGKALEEAEDYKGAINVYVRGQRYDMAESLAQRISPELVEHVKRARVQAAIEQNTASARDELDGIDKEAALRAHVANNDWDKAMRLARQIGADTARTYAAMWAGSLVREGNAEKALEVITRDGMESSDFRFFQPFVQLAEKILCKLPSDTLDLNVFHDGLVKMVAEMQKTGQPEEVIAHADAMCHIIHAYATSKIMRDNGLGEMAMNLMLTLPRYTLHMPPDKAYFDAGMAAKAAGNNSIAYVFLNRFVDITNKIEDHDTSPLDNSDFVSTDFPFNFPIPETPSVEKAQYDAANSWVVSKALDASVSANLPTIPCPKSGVEMFVGSILAPSGVKHEECAITSFPVLGAKVKCKSCSRTANLEEWNKFTGAIHSCPWCKSPQNPEYKAIQPCLNPKQKKGRR